MPRPGGAEYRAGVDRDWPANRRRAEGGRLRVGVALEGERADSEESRVASKGAA